MKNKTLSKLGLLAPLGIPAMLAGLGQAEAAQPRPWEINLQPAASGIMSQIRWFELYTLWFIIPIVLLVLFLLLWIIVRFRASANPVPSRTSHNTLIEVIWTIGPVLVLLAIAIPSFQLLTAEYTMGEPQMTVKATGYQWYWGYEYQTPQGVSFDSVILKSADDRKTAGKENIAEYPRLLAVDNELVVPVDTTVRMLVTGSDVIHSWAMPSFGVKMDAVPGRINETWFRADREGLYYGQCSELCGKDHAFMPIAVRVVSKEQFDTWFKAAQQDVGKANKALIAATDSNTQFAMAGN